MNFFGKRNNIKACGSVIINGKIIEGNNICINGDKILVDGKPYEDNSVLENKEINITINGTLDTLKVEGNVNILSGNVENIDASGSVTVNGNVSGDIECNGSVSCGDVGGDIDANGNVIAKSVNGKIDAMSVLCR